MMRRDPLRTMLKVRQATLDEQQRHLSACYEAERAASARADAAQMALQREMEVASRIDQGDSTVESFARWLPTGRKAVQQTQGALSEATEALDHARALLSLARAGVRSVETLIEQRQEEARLAGQRREQATLDDMRRPSKS